MTVNDILILLNRFAPVTDAESWDNIGLMCGNKDDEVTKAALALDVTDKVIDEAIEKGANLIITHHPLLFPPVFSITAQNPTTALAFRCIKEGISVISMHTNLDCCSGGVSDTLAEALNLQDIIPVGKYLRIGKAHKKTSFKEYSDFIKTALKISTLTAVNGGKTVSEVAVAAGACDTEFLLDAISRNADTLVCGEAKYSLCIYAKTAGINLIMAGHHATEKPVLAKLNNILQVPSFICNSDLNIFETL